MPLSNSQSRYLKGQAHHLDPVVTVADKGLSDAVMDELEIQLSHHELIKVKIRAGREQRDSLARDIAERTGAEIIHAIGGVVVYFRPDPNEPKIALPA